MKNTSSRCTAVVLALALVASVGAAQAADVNNVPATEFGFSGEKKAEAPSPFEFGFSGFAFLFRFATKFTQQLSPMIRFPASSWTADSPEITAPSTTTMFGKPGDPGERITKIVDGPDPM